MDGISKQISKYLGCLLGLTAQNIDGPEWIAASFSEPHKVHVSSNELRGFSGALFCFSPTSVLWPYIGLRFQFSRHTHITRRAVWECPFKGHC